GCRNSHTARMSRMTGSAKASLPSRPPKPKLSRARATSLVGANHSTTAVTIASRKNRNGTPSRRSCFWRSSLPKSRAAPPTTWARPIQAAVNSPGFCSATGSFLVPCGPRDDERDDELRELLLVRARDDVDRVVAMCSRYPRHPTPPGSDTRRTLLGHVGRAPRCVADDRDLLRHSRGAARHSLIASITFTRTAMRA